MRKISNNDYLMILALESDPVMSMKTLAKRVNLSWTTVRKRYNNIVANGIIRPPLAKIQSESLGLRRISCTTTIPDYESLQIVEKTLNEHPYIIYRARSIGNEIGIFTQFDIPTSNQAETNLKNFFSKLSNTGLVNEISSYSSLAIRHEVFPDLVKFDISTSNWSHSWDQWFESLEKRMDGELPLPINYETNFHNFTSLHFEIMHQLSKDGTIKQADLAKKLDLSKTEAHRQYKFVMENYIKSLRLNYNRDYFDLSETYMFIISSISIKDQAILFSQLQQNPPPFRFAIEVLKDQKVLLWGNMSASQSNDFIIQLWRLYPNISIFRLNTRDKGSMTYYFWPPNFDFDVMEWRVDPDYMINDPLANQQ